MTINRFFLGGGGIQIGTAEVLQTNCSSFDGEERKTKLSSAQER